MSCSKSLQIAQSKTYPHVYRWGAEPLVYKPIAAKVSSTPLSFTVTAHGMPDGWFAALTDIGFDSLNAKNWPPTIDDFRQITKVDTNTITFNDVDLAREDGTYAAGGSVVYLTPVSLAGASASFKIYDLAGTLVLTVAAVLDDTAKTITVTLSAAQTATLTADQYTYELEATDVATNVKQIACGTIDSFAPGTCPCQ